MMSLQSKSSFLIYLLIIFTTVVMLMTTWTVTKKSNTCECRSCLEDHDPVIRTILDASPKPFLSRNSTVSQEAYQWWQRLQYSPQNYDYFMKTVDKLFQVFPPPPDVGKPGPGRCRTCAVVGNSANLARSHYGPLIDNHDIVIRMNHGRTKGYEKDVGTKTTHHVMYPESAINLANTTHLVFFAFKIRDLEWIFNSLNPADGNGKSQRRANKDLVMILNPPFMKYVHEKWLEKKGRYPSTGFMVVILSLVICDEVSVFGFGADRDGNWNHYFEKLSNTNLKTGPHPGTVEYQAIEDLHKKKALHFYKGF